MVERNRQQQDKSVGPVEHWKLRSNRRKNRKEDEEKWWDEVQAGQKRQARWMTRMVE